jgi:hypothetical protein
MSPSGRKAAPAGQRKWNGPNPGSGNRSKVANKSIKEDMKSNEFIKDIA